MSDNHEFEKSKPYSYLTGCPTGYHKRSSYKTRTGKNVPTRCVRSTTRKNQTSKEFKRAVTAKQSRRLNKLAPSIKSLSRKVCPPGMIERKNYARKYSTAILQKGFTKKSKTGNIVLVKPHKSNLTYVKSACVKDTGLPGKGKESIGPLRKGELHKYGYTVDEPEDDRHAALRKAVVEYGALGVWRKLNAVMNLTTRTIPEASSIYKKDRDWIDRKFGPLKAF